MDVLWNRRFMDAPPEIEIRCPSLTKLASKQLNVANQNINRAVSAIDQYREALKEEINVLQRLFRSRECSFKRHKHFQAMQRVNKCMARYTELQIGDVYNKIKLPVAFSCSGGKRKMVNLELPSRQTLQYVLVRTIGLVDILVQACDYCYAGIEYSWDRLHRGHFVNYCTVAAACLSRLWILCAVFAADAARWYRILRRRVKAFPKAQMRWLPVGTLLPASLQPKLRSGSLATVKEAIKKKNVHCNNSCSPLEALMALFAEENASAKKEPSAAASTSSSTRPQVSLPSDVPKKEELGVAISRDEFRKKTQHNKGCTK